MRELNPRRRPLSSGSRLALQELSALQERVHALGVPRTAALRRLIASRHSTTSTAQREFWLEFSWLDQEYRAAVRGLAEFCRERKDGWPGSRRSL